MANPTTPPTLVPGVARPTRVYNTWIGGKDHSPANGKAADHVIRCLPQMVAGERTNLAFLTRIMIPCTHTQVICLLHGLLFVATGVVPGGEWRSVAGSLPVQSAEVSAGLAAIARQCRETLAVSGHDQHRDWS